MGERNSHRMEPYHRLDIALTLDGKKKEIINLVGPFLYIMFIIDKIRISYILM